MRDPCFWGIPEILRVAHRSRGEIPDRVICARVHQHVGFPEIMRSFDF